MKHSMFAVVPHCTEDEFASAIRSVEQKFSDDVEHIRYTVRDDWSDDPAIFTRILLKDKPSLMKKVESLEGREPQGGLRDHHPHIVGAAGSTRRISPASLFRVPMGIGATPAEGFRLGVDGISRRAVTRRL